MTKDEAIEKAKEAIERAEADSAQRQSHLNVADRWITLAIHAYPAYAGELVGA